MQRWRRKMGGGWECGITREQEEAQLRQLVMQPGRGAILNVSPKGHRIHTLQQSLEWCRMKMSKHALLTRIIFPSWLIESENQFIWPDYIFQSAGDCLRVVKSGLPVWKRQLAQRTCREAGRRDDRVTTAWWPRSSSTKHGGVEGDPLWPLTSQPHRVTRAARTAPKLICDAKTTHMKRNPMRERSFQMSNYDNDILQNRNTILTFCYFNGISENTNVNLNISLFDGSVICVTTSDLTLAWRPQEPEDVIQKLCSASENGDNW